MSAINGVKIRNGRPSDYEKVISVMPDWWGGRDLTQLLPKVFFIHFHNTIYIAELNNELVGFLVGFLSQTDDKVGYIHFSGVNPRYRKAGIGRLLYTNFYDACKTNDRLIVKACTSPINKLSINFHKRIGFEIESGDRIIDDVPVTRNYLGKNGHKVLFRKELNMIREANIEDSEVLASIISASFLDVAIRFSLTQDNCPKHPSNCTTSWIESDMARGVRYFILFQSENPIGCVGLEIPSVNVCYLERLSVLPEMRGRHFGIRLVQHTLDFAISEGIPKISVGIIAEHTELKKWYKNFGFHEVAIKRFSHLPFQVCFMELIAK